MKPKDTSVGVLPKETWQTKSGIEILEDMIAGKLPSPPMGRTLPHDLVEVGPGRAVMTGMPAADFYNSGGVVHGGFAMTLIDSCTGWAIETLLKPGQGFTTIEAKVNFIRPLTAASAPVRVESTVLSAGSRIATAECRLTDAKGELCAFGTATCLIIQV